MLGASAGRGSACGEQVVRRGAGEHAAVAQDRERIAGHRSSVWIAIVGAGAHRVVRRRMSGAFTSFTHDRSL
jgi:hypothetical protein